MKQKHAQIQKLAIIIPKLDFYIKLAARSNEIITVMILSQQLHKEILLTII